MQLCTGRIVFLFLSLLSRWSLQNFSFAVATKYNTEVNRKELEMQIIIISLFPHPYLLIVLKLFSIEKCETVKKRVSWTSDEITLLRENTANSFIGFLSRLSGSSPGLPVKVVKVSLRSQRIRNKRSFIRIYSYCVTYDYA